MCDERTPDHVSETLSKDFLAFCQQSKHHASSQETLSGVDKDWLCKVAHQTGTVLFPTVSIHAHCRVIHVCSLQLF